MRNDTPKDDRTLLESDTSKRLAVEIARLRRANRGVYGAIRRLVRALALPPSNKKTQV